MQRSAASPGRRQALGKGGQPNERSRPNLAHLVHATEHERVATCVRCEPHGAASRAQGLLSAHEWLPP